MAFSDILRLRWSPWLHLELVVRWLQFVLRRYSWIFLHKQCSNFVMHGMCHGKHRSIVTTIRKSHLYVIFNPIDTFLPTETQGQRYTCLKLFWSLEVTSHQPRRACSPNIPKTEWNYLGSSSIRKIISKTMRIGSFLWARSEFVSTSTYVLPTWRGCESHDHSLHCKWARLHILQLVRDRGAWEFPKGACMLLEGSIF